MGDVSGPCQKNRTGLNQHLPENGSHMSLDLRLRNKIQTRTENPERQLGPSCLPCGELAAAPPAPPCSPHHGPQAVVLHRESSLEMKGPVYLPLVCGFHVGSRASGLRTGQQDRISPVWAESSGGGWGGHR